MDDQELDSQFDGIDSGNDSAPESGSESSAPPKSDQSGDQSNSAKRINDLMSIAQQHEARANAAEAELARLRGQKPRGDGKPEDAGAPEAGAGAEDWAALLREQARDQFYASDPRLAEYGVPKEAITGATPAEMREALIRQTKLVDAIETRARNAALVEFGLDPEIGGGAGEPAKDFAAMSKEEFESWVQRAKSGR